MYIHPINRDTIISFMHGIGFGMGKEPQWTLLLKEFISEKYNIIGGALGWPHQIEKYSNTNNVKWTEAFKSLMVQLIEASDRIEYTNELKALRQKLSRI